MTFGSQWVATLENVPMRMRPACSPFSSSTWACRRACSSHTRRMQGRRRVPSDVRRTPARPRSSKATFHSRSRSATMRLTPDWEYDSDSAALVKLPSSTVLTNAWYFWMLASTAVSSLSVSAGPPFPLCMQFYHAYYDKHSLLCCLIL